MESHSDFSSRNTSCPSEDMQLQRNSSPTTETIPLPKPRVPPPLPLNAPIGTSFPSPPMYTSPIYRPDIDLSLPPNYIPERNQVILFWEILMIFK